MFDLARLTYRVSFRLAYFTSSSFPYLYIAREYVRTNNFTLAEKFYGEARTLAPKDPMVLYEVGVLQIKKAEYVPRFQAKTADERTLSGFLRE